MRAVPTEPLLPSPIHNRRRADLTRDEFFALASWHEARAGRCEEDIDDYGPGYDEQKRQWAASAAHHRERALFLYDEGGKMPPSP